MHELERDMRTIVDIAAKYRGSCKRHSEIDFNLAGIDMRAHEILEIIRLTRSGQHLNMPEEWKPWLRRNYIATSSEPICEPRPNGAHHATPRCCGSALDRDRAGRTARLQSAAQSLESRAARVRSRLRLSQ